MTSAVTVGGRFGAGARRLGYRDPRSGCDIVITTPSAEPRLWRDYLAGALATYRAHGVEHALDFEQMQDGRSSSLIFVVLGADGRAIGGIRTQGPYTRADQAHAVAEWEGDPGQAAVRATIERMVPDGVVEVKAAWGADDHPARRELVACMSRTPIHAATVLGARYAVGTAAAHSLLGWARAGAVTAPDVSPVAYPDERFRTRLAWFDLSALSPTLTERERRALDDEAAQLRAPLVPTQAAR